MTIPLSQNGMDGDKIIGPETIVLVPADRISGL